MAEDKTKQAPETGQEKKFRCGRCGWTEDKRTAPSEEDLREYLRCVLGGKQFTKTYPLYAGKIRMTFRSCSSHEADSLNRLYAAMTEGDNTVSVQELSLKLKLLQMLAVLELETDRREYKPPAIKMLDEIGPAFNERFGELNEILIRSLAQTLMIFLDLQGLLVAEGLDENFWKGAGLRSL